MFYFLMWLLENLTYVVCTRFLLNDAGLDYFKIICYAYGFFLKNYVMVYIGDEK